jgi:NADH-quinone oxidoreductase subunit N
MDDYNGLYLTNPKLSVLMTHALFSLAGIPPCRLFSKFFIFMAAFKAGFHLLVFIALLNTVISLYYTCSSKGHVHQQERNTGRNVHE